MFGHDAENTGFDPDAVGPKCDVEIVWRVTGGTPTMNSSPVVVDGTVYAAPTGGAGGIFAINASSGDGQWRFDTEGYVTSAPAVVDGTLYAGTWGQTVHAIDIAEGKEGWSVEYPNEHRFGRSSPVVMDDTVYLGSVGYGPFIESGDTDENAFKKPALFALDAATGEERWRYDDFNRRQRIDSSPAVAEGSVYFCGDDEANKIYALDADSGDPVWKRSIPTVTEASPAVAEGVVFYGTINPDGPTPCRLWALDAETGETVWTYDIDDQSIRTSPAVADETVYVSASSRKVCLDSAGRDDDCSGVSRGRLYAVDASTGEERWRAATATDTRSSPAVADGVVYVGSGSGLFAVSTDGEHGWHVNLDEVSSEDAPYIDSSPAVADGQVYFGCSDGYLYAIGER